MPLAVALLGLVTQAFVTGSTDQRDLERRTAVLADANTGLERMTREVRQARWVYFRSSQVVDMEAMVRPTTTSQAVPKHVRYDCSTGACVRNEGSQIAFPPPQERVWSSSTVLVGTPAGDASGATARVLSTDVFVPRRVDPATGATSVDYLRPDLLHIRLKVGVTGLSKPLELADGVSLRNATKFAP